MFYKKGGITKSFREIHINMIYDLNILKYLLTLVFESSQYATPFIANGHWVGREANACSLPNSLFTVNIFFCKNKFHKIMISLYKQYFQENEKISPK